MRARFRKLRENKDGFTLVELIVVLVILAILIGMLVPSLTGYIDKANEKAALLECRQVVLAAQVETSEQYGKGVTSVSFGDFSAIREMAEVNGTINVITAKDGKVTYVKYTSKKGIVVIYENGEYRIDGKDAGGSSGGGESGGGSDEPETPDAGEPEGGESGGGNTGGLEFEVDGIKFKATGDAEELYKEAVQKGEDDGNGGVKLPAGLYKVGNQYYYVENEAYYDSKVQAFFTEGGGLTKLSFDAKVTNFEDLKGAAIPGNIYQYKGQYYIAKLGAWGGWGPDSVAAHDWGKIELAQ